jgi:hypothetical protein
MNLNAGINISHEWSENLEQTRRAISDKRSWAPLIPYLTIGIGLLIIHNAWTAIVSYHLSMVTILLFTGRRFSFKNIIGSSNYKIIIATAILGVAGGLLLYFLWPLLGIPEGISLYLQQIGLTAAIWPYFIAYFVLINPWLEECYWRGYLGSNTKKIILNDLLFSGYHIIVLAGIMNVIWLIVIFIVLSSGAWFWRQANRWNQGLSASIVSHLVADASIICIIYFMTIKSI